MRPDPPRYTFPPAPVLMAELRGEPSRLPITLFSDFACPFSYVAESLLRQVEEPVEVVARAFELYPEGEALPAPEFEPGEWRGIESLAEGVGLVLRLPRFRPRTRKAHEASRSAREAGREEAFRRALYDAYWREGVDIGRIDVLAELAADVGLDSEELRIALDIDRYADVVQHDLEVGARLGIERTPTIFIGTGRSAPVVIGTPAPEELRALIQRQLHTLAEPTSDG